MTVAITVGCYYIVRHFRAINKSRDDESIAKKKVADRRVAEAAHADHVAELGSSYDVHPEDVDVGLLDGKRR